jgi:GDPmannose 4,6-dehydratase
MLQQDKPSDYIIGTGITYSVGDFCRLAFERVGLDYHNYVVQDPRFIRPPERAQLVANPHKARKNLGWIPQVSFEELVFMMVDADINKLNVSQKIDTLK